MPMCGGLPVVLLVLAVVVSGQADTGVDDHANTSLYTEEPSTTSTSVVSQSPSAAIYLPRPTTQEPADPCKAGNYYMPCLFRFIS